MKRNTLKKRLTIAIVALGLPIITTIPMLAQGTTGTGSTGPTTNSPTLSTPPGTTTAPFPRQQSGQTKQGTIQSSSPSYNTNTGTLNNSGTNAGTTAPYNQPIGTNSTNTGVPAGDNPSMNDASSGSVPSSNGTFINPAAGSFPSGQPPATKLANDPAIVIPLPSDTASRSPR